MKPKPRAIDLYCGLGGWTHGLLAEGWDVIGIDIELHAYGDNHYPAQLVLQDVRTIHGAQFKDASLIVASSPCQEFSWRAMPWKAGRALTPEELGVPSPSWWVLPVSGKGPRMNEAQLAEWLAWQTEHPRPGPFLGMELFAQAERIQREAIVAAGRFIPMIQENVRGAQKYVGRARWHYGSFYLWGDVPALMPIAKAVKVTSMGASWYHPSDPRHVPGLGFNTHADRQARVDDSVKVGGARGDDWFTHHNRPEFEDRATKNSGGSWFNVAHNTDSGKGQNPDGRKVGGDWFGDYEEQKLAGTISPGRLHGKNSQARKAASARIAKIPFALASHIARVYHPDRTSA